MFHVKHSKRTELNSVLFNISITLILNAWVGIHPTTRHVLYFKEPFMPMLQK